MSESIFIAILAAGEGRRFGGGKLDCEIAGKPLGRYALDAALALDAGHPLIVVGEPLPRFASEASVDGVADLVVNPDAEHGIATSVALAASRAEAAGSPRLLLLLADMPLVSAPTLRRIASAADGRAAAVRHPDGSPGIPAAFPRALFASLRSLRGDRGAAALLRASVDIALIDAGAEELRDVDTESDRSEIERLLKSLSRA